MGKYVVSRLAYAVITFFIIASLSFFMMQTLPGSPFNDAKLTAQQKQGLYEKYGLDQPVPIQYYKYMSNILKGDLGVSFQFDGREVTEIISQRIGPSTVLALQALIFGTLVGLALGIAGALKHNTSVDYTAMIISVLGAAIPSFIFAGLLQYWVGVKLHWLPVAFWQGFKYTILPTVALSVTVIATVARFIRTELLEVLNQDYMMTARVRGLSDFSIVMKHGLRNAVIPLLTIMGPLVVGLITGSLVIEKIFSIPGLGEQFVKSIMTNDYPVIMGTTLFYSVLFIGATLAVDLLYTIVDPRIRLSGGKTP